MADVINDEVPSDPAATKVCKKCGRRFPTSEFVSARGTPTLLCRICRKSSNDSHRRKRQGVAAGPVNPQPQPLPQQQQQQQQTQQAMTAQPSAVHQQQHLQLEQHAYFEEFQDEGFEEFLQYPPVPIDGLLPLATSNNDDDHSSVAPTGGNVEHTNTSAQFEQEYTDNMNSLFVANNSETHAEYPAIVPRIITDLQAVFESDAADVTSAMPFSEHSNGATIETRRTGQLEQYRVRVDSQAFLERIE